MNFESVVYKTEFKPLENHFENARDGKEKTLKFFLNKHGVQVICVLILRLQAHLAR